MFKFEEKTVLKEELGLGLFPKGWAHGLWAFWVLFLGAGLVYFATTACFVPPLQLAYLAFIAVLLARLAMLDMVYFLLLNIYTLPLIALGVLYHGLFFTGVNPLQSVIGAAVSGGLGFAVALLAHRLKGEEAFGMGDVKLMAAFGAWVGIKYLSLAFSVAFCFNLLMACFIKRQNPIPFGVGLVVGLWAFTVFKGPIITTIGTIFATFLKP